MKSGREEVLKMAEDGPDHDRYDGDSGP